MGTAAYLDERFTSGQVAQILEVPAPTIRSWHQLGYLDFVREVGEELKPGRWSRFSIPEIQQIAVMVELTRSGVSPKLASAAAEYSRFAIFESTYLCLARMGDVYARSHAKNLSDLDFPANWYGRRDGGLHWRVEWLDSESNRPQTLPEPCIPTNLILVRTKNIREFVDRQLTKFQESDEL